MDAMGEDVWKKEFCTCKRLQMMAPFKMLQASFSSVVLKVKIIQSWLFHSTIW